MNTIYQKTEKSQRKIKAYEVGEKEKAMNKGWNLTDKLPSITTYSNYLNIASIRFSLTMNECRDRFGLFTNQQWETLLN